mgnify:CR=1 FL=1
MLKTFFQARFPENAFFHFFLSVCVLVLTGVLCVSDAFAKSVFVLRMEDDILSVSDWPNSNKVDERIRFYGVRFPSANEPMGKEAKEFLLRFLRKGAKIDIQVVSVNTEDGVGEALIQVDGHSINYALVDQGLAWVDRHECNAPYCRRWHLVEHKAVQDRKGIWGLDLETPPWQWHYK